jgi:glycosyltransferase involved in cell wall biosynthesis
VPRTKLLVIPNSIDTSEYRLSTEDHLRARDRLLPEWFRDRRVAIMASRLHPAKRHDRALAAAMTARTPLIVVGDGPDRARLEGIASGNRDVLFVGHRDNVREWLAAADVYLYCGAPTDGMPLAVLEAAASGLGLVGFEGDPGAELVAACGGVLLAHAGLATAEHVAAAAHNAVRGEEYVRAHHDRAAWISAYEAVFREAAA